MTESSVPPRSVPADADALAGAVELARAAAVETAGDPDLVGEHLGAVPEPVAPVPRVSLVVAGRFALAGLLVEAPLRTPLVPLAGAVAAGLVLGVAS